MNKKNNLALQALFIVALLSLFTSNIFAQKIELTKAETTAKPCSGEKFVMPTTISVGNEVFADYLKVASLQDDERGQAFDKLSNDQKAGFVKVQFALQLIKRPNLTKDQKSYLLDAISKVSPDFYDKQNTEKVKLSNKIGEELESKALGIFVPREAFEILDAFHADKKEDVALLQNYEDLLKSGMELRKKIVKEMPMSERVRIWQTQLAYHLATASITREQKEFIVEMLPNIQSILEASSNLSKNEQAEYLEKLESSIFKSFSKTEAFAIFMSVGIHKFIDDTKDYKQLSMWSCNCRWYCSNGGSCGGSCSEASRCGPLDTWDCTGICGRSRQE